MCDKCKRYGKSKTAPRPRRSGNVRSYYKGKVTGRITGPPNVQTIPKSKDDAYDALAKVMYGTFGPDDNPDALRGKEFTEVYIDELSTEKPCVCDFRGPNAWFGCRCGSIERKGD